MINKKKIVAGFVLHDPLARMEHYITDASVEALEEAVDNGLILMVEYSDETRDYVTPQEVNFGLLNQPQEFFVVMQKEFIPFVESLVELMDESMTPAVSVLSLTPGLNNTSRGINSKFEAFKQKAQNIIDLYKPNLEGEDNGDNA